MVNIWTPIVLRVPCIRQASANRAKPLLQLFNGFRQYHSKLGRADEDGASMTRTSRRIVPALKIVSLSRQHAPLSTSSILQAKGNRTRKAKPTPIVPKKPTASKLEPARTVASHTEGVPYSDDATDTQPTAQLTWRDYAPEGGMPLAEQDLTSSELDQIFGAESVSPENGNYVLNVMNWRRQSGALIDVGVTFPADSGISQDVAFKALQHIRSSNSEFDEEAAGQVWADEETLRMYEQIQERSVKLGLYKRDPEQYEEDEELQGTSQGRERTGTSALEAIRAQNEAVWEQEQAEKKEKEKKEQSALLYTKRGPLELAGGIQPAVKYTIGPEGGIMVAPANTRGELAQQKAVSWREYHAEQAQIIKDNVIPNLTVFQRLGPALIVTVLTVGFCFYLSNNYTPAPSSARLFPDIPPAIATMGAITALNMLVFIACRWPPLFRFSNKYLQLSPAYPFAMSLLGSTWRHDTLFHLANNLLVLWLFGPMLHNDVGRGSFLAIYVGSGVLGGYISLFFDVLLRRNFNVYGIGASGCAMGTLAAACVVRPSGTVTIFGYEIPMAAWVFLALTGVNEGVAIVRGVAHGINHVAHLGGLVSGGAGAMYIRLKAQRERAGVDLMTEMKRVTEGVDVSPQ